MYCPKCHKTYSAGNKWCMDCEDENGMPIRLIEEPTNASGFNLKFGDANAISGGVNLSDSHNVHNEDHSVHNTKTVNNNVSNVTNKITHFSARKTKMEILQESKTLYLNECKRAYEDNVLEQSEVIALEECRIKIGLDKVTADTILESVRVMTERNARKTSLNPIARTKLKILTDNLRKNEVKALMDQIDGLEALVKKYEHDELSRKYFLVLAALKPEKCIELKENSKIDSYWKSFWSYLAYIKTERVSEAENIIVTLDRFADYPEDNMTVLAVAGALMQNNISEAKEYLNALTGDYTPALQCFVDSIYLLLDPVMSKDMGANENICAFYLVNFFCQKDPKARAEEEERLKKEAELRKEAEEMQKKADFPYIIFWVDADHNARMLTYNSLYRLHDIDKIHTSDDIFNAQISKESIDNPKDVLNEMFKEYNRAFAFYPKDSNPFDCMDFCIQNNIPTDKLCIDSEIQTALDGAVRNFENDAIVEYRHDDEVFYAESGGGVLEMLSDSIDETGYEQSEITIHINSNNYFEDLFRGAIGQVRTLNGEMDEDRLYLSVFMSEANLISKQNGAVRNVTKLFDKFETVSYKIRKDIIVGGDALYLEMYKKLYKIPMGQIRMDDKLHIEIKFNHGDLLLYLRHNNNDVCYKLIGNKFQEIEVWHF